MLNLVRNYKEGRPNSAHANVKTNPVTSLTKVVSRVTIQFLDQITGELNSYSRATAAWAPTENKAGEHVFR